MSTVWIINHYAHHHERDGRATRHQSLAEHLTALGWRSIVIAAGTDHPTGRSHLRGLRIRRRWTGEGYDFLWLRGVDYRGAGLSRAVRRVLDIVVFTFLLLVPRSLAGLPRPDVIVGGSFHPLAAWAAARLARRHGVPFVFEPRDLWPESALGLAGMTERHPVIRALRRLEQDIVRRADHIISPLGGVGRYYADRGYHGGFTWVPNGVTVDQLPGERPRDAGASLADAPFTIAYIGSMGPANALEVVIDAFDQAATTARARGLRPLALRMVGDGADVTALRERASSLPSAASITWDGRVSQGEARAIGRQADCLVVNMHDLPLYRHGVSMNKQYEYMLLERPLLVGAPVPLESVEAAECGVHVPADDAAALAEGMLTLASMSDEERAAMGARGRAHVIREHDYGRLARTYASALAAAVRR
ncbi:glycosyltransferase family 4 protein [Curtobacterium sp. 'Ferrero']|uniref:glycosyltransferase family 4 protein n=1 Tax=Curtobacterium sp. 'Ferrero' TaxID=2033654 RepID=UPI00159716CC|nr:glycosyltransferase family 4 protein [Curtobacterium sp. 'Ferrero']